MSQDKFWEQWSAGSERPAEGAPAEGSATSAPPVEPGSVDADVLAAWLKSLPPNDPMVPEVQVSPPPANLPTTDLAATWPPSAPVDPFANMQPSDGETSSGSDWDLALDLQPPAPAPAAPSTPAAPPVSKADKQASSFYSAPSEPAAGPTPWSAAAPAPGVPTPAAPTPAATPPADFAFDLGGLAGPAPVASPFELPPTAPTPAALPTMPFGPPPPPAQPPAEALQAPPLRLQVVSGRRTFETRVKGEALIGRPDATRGLHPEIDLRQDDAVSRRHAKIFVKNGKYVLTDLNSTNGTRHNHEWLQPEVEVVLKSGDLIEVGECTKIQVLEAPDAHA